MAALILEIERAAQSTSERSELGSVYIGGGTPTVLSSELLFAVLAAVTRSLGVEPDCEVTIEANPGTVDAPKLAALRQAGFNRLSLGVQSLDDDLLRALGRIHTADEALVAFDVARAAGFANLGIDLMFALPGQDMRDWRRTLEAAVGLGPEHVSLYELSIDEGTRFAELHAQGMLSLPDEDTKVEMYELAIALLTCSGFEHYEVSNFARPGFRSRHNQVYWRNEPYHGFGAGATSYLGGERACRLRDPMRYIEEVESGRDAIESRERLTGRALLAETIIQRLRMLEGIDLAGFAMETGVDLRSEFDAEIDTLSRRGLVEVSDGRLRVTRTGLLLMNDVAMEFLSE